VRLRRGFVNIERAPFGGEKLRIPSLLFVEKMRTQSRFNVRAKPRRAHAAAWRSRVLKPGRLGWQLMRVAPASEDKGRKVTHNASSKVAVVVERMLLPMLDTPLRPHVVFDALDEAEQSELDLVDEVDRRHPGATADATSFLGHMAAMYERYRASCWVRGGGYTEVSRG
jgi:hypothetical protein